METKLAVQRSLESLRSIPDLRSLFADTLNYQAENRPLVTETWTAQRAAEPLCEGRVVASHDDFRVVYCRLDKLNLTSERPIVNQILRHVSPYALVVFADERNEHWHFVNVKYDEEAEKRRVFRRISVGPDERLHTAVERLATLEIADESIPALALQIAHDKAFDVQPVTRDFYDKYKELFDWTMDVIRGEHGYRETQAFTQQLFNRMMFLYFVQKLYWDENGARRYWLDNDHRYMSRLFNRYKECGKSDEFLSLWLDSLFFQAFCKRFGFQTKDLPQEVKNELATMPWLNGGLFQKNKWDRQGFSVPDLVFERLYKELLEHFNFTVREDTPVDIEVAVDPVMLGHVYENLILEEERGRGGIFYTPATELDFMCRLAVMEYLKGGVPLSDKEVNRLVMDVVTPHELPEYEPGVLAAVSDKLRELKVVDPACGSGAFLVTMMNVVAQVHQFIASRTGHPVNLFELKKRIIADNLYGVDIKEWACRVAELRLWLSLIVETEGRYMDNMYLEPLLPNLDYKIRQGDSLVEEIEGESLSLRGHFATRSARVAKKVNQFIRGKEDYYYNRGDRAEMAAELKQVEMQILWEIIDSKLDVVNRALGALESSAADEFRKQLSFLREEPEQPGLFEETEEARKQRRARREELAEEKQRLLEARTAIGKKEERDYFLWEIDFAEVFQEKEGFDIVIGNPPYVRQEAIAPQNLLPDETTPEIKKQYKEQLIRSVQTLWGQDLKIDRRSDLYIYFYLHGLGLLRPQGVFCFITSNSWLDVGYGAGLQQFLLERIKIKGIYDNLAKRSFAASDVNTIIALFQKPAPGETVADNTARFVAFKKPFEEVTSAATLSTIQGASEPLTTDDYRLRMLTQGDLLVDGLSEQPDTGEVDLSKLRSIYAGSKWGGKYLRAPDIYFTILEKGKDKLVRLGDIAEVRFGIKTGANEFFYLPSKHFDLREDGDVYRLMPKHEGLPSDLAIEREFMRPMLFSLKEVDTVVVDPSRLQFRLFSCPVEYELLRQEGYQAAGYVEWGATLTSRAGVRLPEAPSLRNRSLWYDVGEQEPVDIISNRFIGDRFVFPMGGDFLVCDVFFVARLGRADRWTATALMNSTTTLLTAEVLGRKTYGIGVMYLYGPEINGTLLASPHLVDEEARADLQAALSSMAKRKVGSIWDEVGEPDRRQLDSVVAHVLGLTSQEVKTVYDELVPMVRDRLEKAKSV
jgi:type I restriction-modification system DNA methylase subunit